MCIFNASVAPFFLLVLEIISAPSLLCFICMQAGPSSSLQGSKEQVSYICIRHWGWDYVSQSYKVLNLTIAIHFNTSVVLLLLVLEIICIKTLFTPAPSLKCFICMQAGPSSSLQGSKEQVSYICIIWSGNACQQICQYVS